MEFLYFWGGILLGFAVASIYLASKLHKQRISFNLEKFEVEKARSLFEDRYLNLQKEREAFLLTIQKLQAETEQKSSMIARLDADLLNLQEKLDNQQKMMDQLQQKFATDFELVAAKILKQNTQDFSAEHRKSLDELLSPLKEKIQVFERKVEDTYEKGLKDQTDLRAELKKLHDLNLKISDEANNLTKALKGDVKKQGNWGEVILESVLERSGLTLGREYEKQESVISATGQRLQPDVVVHLPDRKHIIIDSKVSLVAYEKLVNAIDEKERTGFVREHLQSVRNHIRLLSEKHYQNIPAFNSPDFVLLFIPIESSFSVAVQEDHDLFSYAWDNKVVIVSPTTLLATLRTIASIWQQENQTRNALEIARQGGALYDKFVSFIADMESIGRSLETTRKTFDQATNKLYSGSGNLVARAEKIRKLGAKTSKDLPIERLSDED